MVLNDYSWILVMVFVAFSCGDDSLESNMTEVVWDQFDEYIVGRISILN